MLNRSLLARAAFCCWVFLTPHRVQGDVPVAQRLSLRYTAGASLMVSSDQRSWLSYAAPGLVSDLQLALRLKPALAVQLGLAGGIFFSPVANGALLAPMIGATLHWTLASFPTYAAVSVGAALTGELVRPFARAVLGIDWSLSSQLSAGPVFGVDLVTQQDGALYSSDALYGWVGLGLVYRPVRAAQRLQRERVPDAEPPPLAAPTSAAPPLPFELAPEHEPAPPSAALSALIDEAVHVSHTELLAPVLFEYDSVELEPSSVAMLHEVARLLNHERRDIQLLAVIAYSDKRGPAQYNIELSRRRAQRVRNWLVAHDVAAERLSVEARGASEPVEVGEEADHQQNRRVVFRVLKLETPP